MKQVTLYTTGCPKCLLIKHWLAGQGIDFAIKQARNAPHNLDLAASGLPKEEGPILYVNGVYYPAGKLFNGGMLRTKEILEALQ